MDERRQDAGPDPQGRPPGSWRFIVRLVRTLLRLRGWRVQAQPPEPRPAEGQPLVVVINHTSAIDAFLVADTVWRRLRRWVQPLVKRELYRAPVIGAIARRAGAIPVDRGVNAGREAAYAAAVERLRQGSTILIAPEGTITHDGSLLPLRHGAARLALEAGVDVLVVTHFGAQRAFSPVARLPQSGAVVTMAMDVVSPWPDEDAAALTGRIAAVMLDRSEALAAAYPQADPDAVWWPPYATPAAPSAVAMENLGRYRQSMAEAVEQARERMARFAEEHHVEERLADSRERARARTEELAARSRARAEDIAHRAEELAARSRERADDVGHRAEELAKQARQLFEELSEQARAQAETFSDRFAQHDEPRTLDTDDETRDREG